MISHYTLSTVFCWLKKNDWSRKIIAWRTLNNFKNSQRKSSILGSRPPSSSRHFGRGGRSSSHSWLKCQLWGKFGHVVAWCYHHFNMHFQGRSPPFGPSPSFPDCTVPITPSPQAMVATPSSLTNDECFFDTGVTHHLTQEWILNPTTAPPLSPSGMDLRSPSFVLVLSS